MEFNEREQNDAQQLRRARADTHPERVSQTTRGTQDWSEKYRKSLPSLKIDLSKACKEQNERARAANPTPQDRKRLAEIDRLVESLEEEVARLDIPELAQWTKTLAERVWLAAQQLIEAMDVETTNRYLDLVE